MELSGQKKLNYNNNAGNVEVPLDSPGLGNFIVFYPSSSLVIMKVHKLPGIIQSSRNFIGLSLANVDKVLSKSEQGEVSSSQREYRYLEDCPSLVSVLDVVPAPAPDPRRLEILRPVRAATAAARQLPVLTKYYVA